MPKRSRSSASKHGTMMGVWVVMWNGCCCFISNSECRILVKVIRDISCQGEMKNFPDTTSHINCGHRFQRQLTSAYVLSQSSTPSFARLKNHRDFSRSNLGCLCPEVVARLSREGNGPQEAESIGARIQPRFETLQVLHFKTKITDCFRELS